MRVFSLLFGVNLGPEHQTKSAIYFAGQMQGKLCGASQFFCASPFFWDPHQQERVAEWLSDGSAKGPMTQHAELRAQNR